MVRTLIIDDDPSVRKDIVLFMEKQPEFIVTGHCGTIAEAKVLIAGTSPDLLLLDIELPDGTGFDLLDELPDRNFNLVFITAYDSYAIRAIRTGAFDYLLKPLNENEFIHALQRIKEQPLVDRQQQQVVKEYLHAAGPHSRITLRYDHCLHFIPFREIIYCRGEGPYTTFHLTDNRQPMLSRPIKEYEELLPANLFVRTHKGYLVNAQYVDRLHSDGYLVLKNGTEIPVSMRRKEFVEKFLVSHS